jgi:hypothetical protein
MLQVCLPMSLKDSQDRDLIEVMLAIPASAENRAMEGPGFDTLQAQLAVGVARHFLSASLWSILKRSTQKLPTNP